MEVMEVIDVVRVRKWKVIYPDLELRRGGNAPSYEIEIEPIDDVELISEAHPLWVDFFYMLNCYVDSIEDEIKKREIKEKIEAIKEQYIVDIEIVEEEIYSNDWYAINKAKPDFKKLTPLKEKVYLKELLKALERFRDEEIVPILDAQEQEKEKNRQQPEEDAETRLYNAIFGQKDERPEAPICVMVKDWKEYRLPDGCKWLDITASSVYLGFVAVPDGARFVTIKVPQEIIGKVIGKGGQNIKTIQDRYGIKIKVESI